MAKVCESLYIVELECEGDLSPHKLMGSFTTARCPETHYLCCKVHLD